MDPTPLISAGIAVVGTLSGVVITQRSNRRGERERRTEEDRRRWLDDRLRICLELRLLALRAERGLSAVLTYLPDDTEPGSRLTRQWSSILASPDEDLPGIIDKAGRRTIARALRAWPGIMEEMEMLEGSLSLHMEGDIVQKSREMVNALVELSGHIEKFGHSLAGHILLAAAQGTREEFTKQAREDLGLVTKLR